LKDVMNTRSPNWDTEPGTTPQSFDDAHPVVYSYLLRRCGSIELAEDLTTATFVTALADTARAKWALPWLLVVARNKLIDHWRREQRAIEISSQQQALAQNPTPTDDHTATVLEAIQIAAALGQLSIDHRLAIVLRYLDDLPVAAVADEIGRSVRATESLLVRARKSFSDAYGTE